jgi:hypothetical protein
MVARNSSPYVSPSNAVRWRRWEAGSLRAFAQVGTIRWPNVNDLRGRPLPPVPQLTAIISSAAHRGSAVLPARPASVSDAASGQSPAACRRRAHTRRCLALVASA